MRFGKTIALALVTVSVQQALAGGLFISEYNEPNGSSGNRKILEIYNGSAAIVDLSTLELHKGTGGGAYSSSLVLGPGSLCPGDTWVVANNDGSDVTNPIPNVDQVQSSGVFYFNGDDPIGLTVDGVLVDVIGTTDSGDPGSGWEVAGVANGTKDHTLRRKASITDGTTDWALSAGTDATDSQWEVYAPNSLDDIGLPEATCDTNAFPEVNNITLDPAAPTEDDEVNISADLTDVDGTVNSAVLNWGPSAGSMINVIPMALVAGDTWGTMVGIPDHNACTQIFYQIVATDDDGDDGSSPVRSYTVECVATIAEIQGAGDDSPLDGLAVTTNGVVQRVFDDRFSIQEGVMPRQGLIVFTGSAPAVMVGDEVTVAGTIDEYFGLTEMTGDLSVVVNATGGMPYAPVVLDAMTAATEDYEGMLVNVLITTVLSSPSNYGEFMVEDGSGQIQIDNEKYFETLEPEAGDCYSWTAVQWYNFGDFTLFPQWAGDAINCNTADTQDLVGSFSLNQNYPNPFNPSTTIAFNIAQLGDVSLKVYDLNGAVVSTLVSGILEAGAHNVTFDASSLSSGVYFYSLQSENLSQTRKMVLVK